LHGLFEFLESDASHVRVVESSDAYGGFTGGTTLDEGTGTGNFNASSISGSSYVFGWGGNVSIVSPVASRMLSGSYYFEIVRM
jgi:hypothetical protein